MGNSRLKNYDMLKNIRRNIIMISRLVFEGALGGLIIGIAIGYILPPHQFPPWSVLIYSVILFTALALGFLIYHLYVETRSKQK